MPAIQSATDGAPRLRYLSGVGAAALLSWALAGCTANPPIVDTFPTPLVESYPLKAGIRLTPEFTQYEYRQRFAGEKDWVVSLGAANESLFKSVFTSMFQETYILESDEATDAVRDRLDLIIKPEVESYEFSVPYGISESHYTVWITYRMKVYQADGRLITEWPVRAYGKSRYRLLDADGSLANATEMALRDAGAYTVVHFPQEPLIREWLRETGALQESEAALAADPGLDEPPPPPTSEDEGAALLLEIMKDAAGGRGLAGPDTPEISGSSSDLLTLPPGIPVEPDKDDDP